MKDDVYIPINERRQTCNYETKFERNKINRMFNSLCQISDKINDLESRILNLENIYEEYNKAEIEKLKTENELLRQEFRQVFVDIELGEKK